MAGEGSALTARASTRAEPAPLAGPVRLRFAPSPTGYLHVGGARTAIYNDLLRQSLGGAYVLRIEDTDRARSDEAMTRQIEEALRWTGVAWDEGPFLQSERQPRHAEAAQRLLADGNAYYCFCTTEQLDPLRREAEREGRTFRYPRTCAHCSTEEVAARRAAGELAAVRFRMPDAPVAWQDLVRGEVEFPAEALDDFVLLRSDGTPTYHLSVVVDDVDMAIDLVLRGEDHVSNTPKHIRLFEALGAKLPRFGHLPLILGPDKRRLSKRTGATSVEEFRGQGILPEAFYNFLALLGWSPGDGRELMSRDELVAAFSLDRVSNAAAVFDPEKLLWMTGQYLWKLPVEELVARVAPFAEAAGLGEHAGEPLFAAAVGLQQLRARTLVELAEQLRPYFTRELAYDEAASRKYLQTAGLDELLGELASRWSGVAEWRKEALEEALRALATERGVKAAALIHPVRMALSASTAGPPLFDLVEVMGREETAARIARYRESLASLAVSTGS
ncbi:MAG TPA: glutamate--tRNA ligase [Thermoanaerobaculia bacterium]|nr:glutamate--tRNA ligase [Thermoanaerobaculia bacterium]HXT51947.1 glutamate--tRNA ligase [Thermoanaerobaculia bacterium]